MSRATQKAVQIRFSEEDHMVLTQNAIDWHESGQFSDSVRSLDPHNPSHVSRIRNAFLKSLGIEYDPHAKKKNSELERDCTMIKDQRDELIALACATNGDGDDSPSTLALALAMLSNVSSRDRIAKQQVEQFEARIVVLNDEQDSLLESHEETLQEVKKYEEIVEARREEKETLVGHLENAQALHSQTEEELEIAKVETAEAKVETAEAKVETAEATAELEILKVKDFEGKLETAKNALEGTKGDLSELQTSINSLPRILRWITGL